MARDRQLTTLEDAGNYVTRLPKAEHEAAEWQAAMEALILVATLDDFMEIAPPPPAGHEQTEITRKAGNFVLSHRTIDLSDAPEIARTEFEALPGSSALPANKAGR